jgi:hypothetical protein
MKKFLKVLMAWVVACVLGVLVFNIVPPGDHPGAMLMCLALGAVAGLYTFTEYF